MENWNQGDDTKHRCPPEQEINYLHQYTKGDAQELVDSHRCDDNDNDDDNYDDNDNDDDENENDNMSLFNW